MSDPSHEILVYCLTRDHALADAVEARLSRALAFFYNDAARLHQAVVLRRPDLVLVDTGAIRQEYGEAGPRRTDRGTAGSWHGVADPGRGRRTGGAPPR